MQLERLAVYFDTHSSTSAADKMEASPLTADAEVGTTQWAPAGGWDSLGPDDGDRWWRLFGPGVQDDAAGGAVGRQYLLHPVGRGLPDIARLATSSNAPRTLVFVNLNGIM